MSRKERRDRQKGRRALDYRAMMSLNGDVLRVRPYTGHAAIASRSTASADDGASGSVVAYDVEALVPLPVSETEAVPRITLRLDLSATTYPRSAPLAIVVSERKPFCTHVNPTTGLVCLGNLWEELGGKEIAAELALRLFQAFNFQDPPVKEYGFQPDAYFYYMNVLKERPFNPALRLPAVPDSVFVSGTASTPRSRVVLIQGHEAVRPHAVIARSRVCLLSGGGAS